MTILFTISWYSIAVSGSPIRTSADLWIFAPPRSFSQLVTSFFGSWCQGILRMLLFAWPLQKIVRFFGSSFFKRFKLFLRTIFLDSLISFEFHYVSKSFYCFFVLFRYLSRFRSFLVTLFYLKKPFLFSYSFSYSVLKQQFFKTSSWNFWDNKYLWWR